MWCAKAWKFPRETQPILSKETNSQIINDDLDRRLAELQKQNNQ